MEDFDEKSKTEYKAQVAESLLEGINDNCTSLKRSRFLGYIGIIKEILGSDNENSVLICDKMSEFVNVCSESEVLKDHGKFEEYEKSLQLIEKQGLDIEALISEFSF